MSPGAPGMSSSSARIGVMPTPPAMSATRGRRREAVVNAPNGPSTITRVLAEGPFGSFTNAARRRPRAALIAGGVGITPIRALLEEMPGGPEDITVLYRVLSAEDLILREELDELAGRRGVQVHYVLGGEPLSVERLQALMPDIAARDVYVCGPPAMAEATRDSLLAAAVPRRQIVMERFAL